MSDHTPTPWVLCTKDCISDEARMTTIASCSGSSRISLGEQEANAGFIVRAANAHDALVEVAKMVDAWGHGIRHHTAHESSLVKTARAALKLAEGP